MIRPRNVLCFQSAYQMPIPRGVFTESREKQILLPPRRDQNDTGRRDQNEVQTYETNS
jgi:hypothetical protein